ncbi:hypothetical protein C7N43_15690 [Sphingobacteriales bacterium UPWRP_1]|nr:hypothetical protein BVG80_04335 [Sphingobacteriales bacterium TSM_CSM]PSJ76050.1 hypothetical protein C7N43_15690 [Sphingobacteriales bacterium UPWRP_1]
MYILINFSKIKKKITKEHYIFTKKGDKMLKHPQSCLKNSFRKTKSISVLELLVWRRTFINQYFLLF